MWHRREGKLALVEAQRGEAGVAAGLDAVLRRRRGSAPFKGRRHRRFLVDGPAVVSWESSAGRRELTGSCVDFSQGGARIKLGEFVPPSTRVYLRFPDLHTEASAVVRSASEDSIGVEFTDLIYYGPPQKHQTANAIKDGARCLRAVLGLALWVAIAYCIPGLLPSWVPFSRRPDQPLPEAPSLFTLGSTKPQVYAAQGPPTLVTESTWHYGSSRVFFRGDFVTGWSVSSDRPLHTGSGQPRSTGRAQDTFKLGSSAAEVIAAEGPPTQLTDDVWRYGASEVYFKDGKVIGWKSTEEYPLKTESTQAKRQTRTSAERRGGARPPLKP